jgi:hypothetical protein
LDRHFRKNRAMRLGRIEKLVSAIRRQGLNPRR